MQLEVDLYYMTFDWRVPQQWNQGGRPIVVLGRHIESPHALRANPILHQPEHKIANGGWHLSYFDTPQGISDKIKSFSHTELNTPEFTDIDKIAARRYNGRDPFERFDLERVTDFSSLPLGVLHDRQKYQDLFL